MQTNRCLLNDHIAYKRFRLLINKASARDVLSHTMRCLANIHHETCLAPCRITWPRQQMMRGKRKASRHLLDGWKPIIYSCLISLSQRNVFLFHFIFHAYKRHVDVVQSSLSIERSRFCSRCWLNGHASAPSMPTSIEYIVKKGKYVIYLQQKVSSRTIIENQCDPLRR